MISISYQTEQFRYMSTYSQSSCSNRHFNQFCDIMCARVFNLLKWQLNFFRLSAFHLNWVVVNSYWKMLNSFSQEDGVIFNPILCHNSRYSTFSTLVTTFLFSLPASIFENDLELVIFFLVSIGIYC